MLKGSLRQREQTEVLLAGLDDTIDIHSPKIFGEELYRVEIPVEEQYEVAVPDHHPFLLIQPNIITTITLNINKLAKTTSQPDGCSATFALN